MAGHSTGGRHGQTQGAHVRGGNGKMLGAKRVARKDHFEEAIIHGVNFRLDRQRAAGHVENYKEDRHQESPTDETWALMRLQGAYAKPCMAEMDGVGLKS